VATTDCNSEQLAFSTFGRRRAAAEGGGAADGSVPEAGTRQAVLDLMMITPVYLTTLVTALSPALWQEKWGDLVSLFRVGGRKSARDSWSVAMVDILARIGRSAESPAELNHLPDVALLATTESDAVLVNHAAYGLVSWMETSSDSRLGFAIDTIERLALDHRLAVRQAAAYGAARLRRSGQDVALRARMTALDERFATRRFCQDPTSARSR